MPGVIQRLRLELDQSSVKKLGDELRATASGVADWITGELEKVQGDEAGKKAGKEVIAGLQQSFDADLDALNLRFQRGLIKADQFQAQGVAAAKRFNDGLRIEIDRFANNPAFSVNPFKDLAAQVDPGDLAAMGAAAERAGTAFAQRFQNGIGTLSPESAARLTEPVVARVRETETELSRLASTMAADLSQALDLSGADDAARAAAIGTAQGYLLTLRDEFLHAREQLASGAIDLDAFEALATTAADRFAGGFTQTITALAPAAAASAATVGTSVADAISEEAGRAGAAFAQRFRDGIGTLPAGDAAKLTEPILARVQATEAELQARAATMAASLSRALDLRGASDEARAAAISTARGFLSTLQDEFTRSRSQLAAGAIDVDAFEAQATASGNRFATGFTETIAGLGATAAPAARAAGAAVGTTVTEAISAAVRQGKFSADVAAQLTTIVGQARASAAALSSAFAAGVEASPLDAAGRTKATEFLAGMRAGLEGQLAALTRQVEQGLLDPAEFATKAQALGATFATAVGQGLSQARAGTLDLEPLVRAAERAGLQAGKGVTDGIAAAGPGAGAAAGRLSAEVVEAMGTSAGRVRAAAGALIGEFVATLQQSKLDAAGQAKAVEFLSGLRTGLTGQLAGLTKQVSDGLLDPKDFDAKAQEIGATFSTTLRSAMASVAAGRVDFTGTVEAAKDAGTQAGQKLADGVKGAGVPGVAKDQGVESAKAFVDAVEAETKRSEGRIKIAQAEGLLHPDQAHKKGLEASQAHNQGILRGIAEFRGRGELSPQVLGVFTDAFQGLGDKVPPLSFFERIKHRIRSNLIGLGASLAGLFAAREVFRFAEGSVREFIADDKALQGLRTQITATGKDYEGFAGQIEVVQQRLIGLGAASGGQVAEGIARLIATSGDADKSIRNIGLAADFSAKHHLTFEQGVEAVGRAMVGQTRHLVQYGVFVKRGADAVLAMAADSAGFVEHQAPDLTRSLAVLTLAWRDIKGAIGEALITAGGGTSVINLLTTAIRDGARWIKEHHAEIQALAGALGNLAKAVLGTVIPTLRELGAIGGVISRAFAQVVGAGETLLLRFQFIAGGFAIIAANISDAWDTVLKRLGLWSPDAVADQTIARLRAWGERVQAEAVRQKGEIDKTLAGIGTAAETSTSAHGGADRAVSRLLAGPTTGPTGVGGAVHPAGFGQGGGGGARDEDKLGPRIALLTRATQVESLRASALEVLGKIETELERKLALTGLALEKRIVLEEHLAAVQRARGTLPLESLAPTEQLGVLARTVELTDLRAASLEHLERLEQRFTAEMNDGTKSLDFRAAAEENLRKAQELRGARPFDTLPLEQRIQLLTEATQLEQFREGALGGLARAEEELRATLADTNLSLGRRIELTAQLTAVQDARGTRKIKDLGLDDQIALFRQGLGSADSFAASLRGLQEAEGRLAAEVQAAEPGSVRRFQLEQALYQLRSTLGADSLDDQIRLLATALRSDETRAEAIKELIRLERELAKIRSDPHATPAARDQAEQAGTAVQGALDTAPAGEVAATRAQPDLTPAPGQAMIITPRFSEEALAKIRAQTQSIHELLQVVAAEPIPVHLSFDADLIRTFFLNLHEFATGAAEGITQTFEDTFKNLLDGTENVGQALGHLGKGMAASILGEISKMARGKVVENLAYALEELAKGFAASAIGSPKAHDHFKAAGTFTVAAAKWGLAAGVTGALASAAGGGGGGGGGSDRRAERDDPLARAKAAGIIYIDGDGLIDPNNAAQMDRLGSAIGVVTGRDIVLRRGRP